MNWDQQFSEWARVELYKRKISVKEVALSLDMQPSGVSKKLGGSVPWTLSQAQVVCSLLKSPAELE